MKLRRLVWLVLVLVAVTAVESSILLSQSRLKPRLPPPCFTCRAEDRPLAYPLIAFLGRLKDMLVRGMAALTDSRQKGETKL